MVVVELHHLLLHKLNCFLNFVSVHLEVYCMFVKVFIFSYVVGHHVGSQLLIVHYTTVHRQIAFDQLLFEFLFSLKSKRLLRHFLH